MNILVVNGPNLNLLGTREPSIYGTDTLPDVQERITKHAHSLGVSVDFFQSNSEGALIDHLQSYGPPADGVILNGAGLTHTSVALRDCIAALETKVIEVHLTNIHAREEFRHLSLTAPIAVGIISGLGWKGYIYALDYLAKGIS